MGSTSVKPHEQLRMITTRRRRW